MADGLPTTEALVAMPGPWEVVWLQGDKLGSPSEVCAAGTDNRVAFLASNGTLGTARLIAAAPDLLALLVEARNTRAADIVPGGWADLTLALGALSVVRRLQAEGRDFDLIDAHYYYPDGVLRPCCYEFVPDVGNLNEGKIVELFNGEKLTTLVQRFTSDSPDKSCAACPKWIQVPEHAHFPFDATERKPQVHDG